MAAAMELGHIISALRRHRIMVLVTVVLAVVVAGFSMYKPDGSPRFKPQFTSQTRILVDSANFGLGRVELAQSTDALQGGGMDNRAMTVAFFVDSRYVTDLIPKDVVQGTSAILVTPLEKTPVIQIEVTADSAAHASAMAGGLPRALETYIRSRQEKAGTPPKQRVEITVVAPPTDPASASSMAKALALLAFLMVVGAGFFITILRDNHQRTRRGAGTGGEPGAGPAEPEPAT